MFSLIGLGLHPPASVSVEAWESLQAADVVYLEVYTNLGITPNELADFLKRPVLAAPRTAVENDALLQLAAEKHVALCVIGDIFTATTHSVLYLDCIQKRIPIQLFPNAGIMNIIAYTGLELYRFGETISIPYPLPSFNPTSYVEKLKRNIASGLHTLCLLDIKADEGRYMTIAEGLDLLAQHGITAPLVIGIARLGTDNVIKAGTPDDVGAYDFGPQPHCIVIPGTLNAIESDFVALWKAKH